jgi:hypothetical protein
MLRNLNQRLKQRTWMIPVLNHRLLRSLQVVNRRDVITVTWLFVAAVLPFVHLRFGERVIDPFLVCSVPMRTDTFVWMLCGGMSTICFAVFAYRACVTRLKVFAFLWVLYCVYDLIMFMWCYNEKNYYYIPYLIMILIAWKLFKK